MDEASDERPSTGRRRFSRRRRIALGVALTLIAGLIALWLVRKPIAERFVDRTLAAAKVPARYTIADLGLGEQRLTGVVIGDPRAPDLVADWIETETRITLHGPELSGVRAGRVRVRGRLVDGKLSLGAIDRLLPKSSGGGFALPKLALSVEDGRMRLETPYGVAGVSLRGKGRVDNGFDGKVAIVSERLATDDCAAERVAAALRVRTTDEDLTNPTHDDAIRLTGPVNVARTTCGGVRTGAVRSDLTAQIVTGARVDWSLGGKVAIDHVAHRLVSAARVAGTFAALGGPRIISRVDIAATGVRGFGATAGRVALDGDAVHDAAQGMTLSYDGKVAVADADARAFLPQLAPLVAATAGTPVAPLAARLAQAASAGAARVGGQAQVNLTTGMRSSNATVQRAAITAATGARVTLSDGLGIDWRSDEGLRVDGTIATGGGGLPQATARLIQKSAAKPLRATLAMAPYEAGGARLALTPVAITGGGTTRVVTRATLSGPLANGRVEGLTMPLDLRLANGALTLNPACAPLAFDRLAIAGLTLRPASLTLCPIDAALVRNDRSGLHGGARLSAATLAGSLGTTPLTLALSNATLRLADRGFVVEGVETRIGTPERVTRLDFARVEGRIANGSVAGRFAGGKGQIANVPLLLSDAAGDWRFERGALTLTGGLSVADAQTAAPRFLAMRAPQVALSLADNTIIAIGALNEPTTNTQVAKVAIRHALSSGSGEATLEVPNLAFSKAFQPNLLTPLTFGVIADVAGTVSGTGHIAWDAKGVKSTGTFRTAGTDLAAAFGPVTGIAGEIRFTDLLALESAPHQVATVKSINPGIAVTDGIIRYQTLPNTRVRVEGGEWPFAGGRLTLDPTLLDFSQTAQRRMTFHVAGVAADRFLQQFDFKNLDATGTFDGVLPMVFDDSGGRIESGNLTVREGGGTIRYVGEITEKDVGFWGNLAFQALKSLRYRSLTLGMNGPLAGEMVTDVRFAGISQGEGAKGNFLVRRLQRLPFVFNIRIKAPFRGLLDSAQSFYDPRRLIQRNLPALLDDLKKRAAPPPTPAPLHVQPPASDTVQ